MQRGNIEILQDNAGEWRFHVKAANGEVVAQSEGYTSNESAKRGAKALVRAVLSYVEGKVENPGAVEIP